MELNTIRDGFDRIAKKQKLCTSKSVEVIDQVGQVIEQALANIQSIQGPTSPADHKSILMELKTKLNAISPNNQLDGSQKELNTNLSKYQKTIEKYFNPDISKAYRNVDYDLHILNHIIVSHFYHAGLFDVADCLINEAGEPEVVSIKLRFRELHRILEAMRARDLKPALYWASNNRESLNHVGSNLELKLHRLQFVEILQSGTQGDALNYARTHLSPLAPLHMDEIQKLMGCLLWVGKLDKCPYSELFSENHWEKVAEELTRRFCSFLGQSYESPLSVAIAAGVEGLPPLIKLANVMAVKKQEWQAMKQLPVPVDLGKEFQFHSIFVCPVSREQGSEENPPMQLPCGHVLCKQSIMKLSKSSTRTFKCPYCPHEASVAQCKQLYF